MNLKAFGASWLPTALGFIGGALEYLSTLGLSLPSNKAEWGHAGVAAAIAGLGAASKQFNVTNAAVPVQPQAVSAATLPPAIPPLVMPPYPGASS